MKTISVVVPCYNEEENVQAMADAIRETFRSELPEYRYEIIFIDNDSSDRTRDIIRLLCREDRGIKAIFNAKNFGQFNSPYYAMLQSTGDCTILMAADFQDPVEMIPRFVLEWEYGYKIVIGIKSASQENRFMYWLRGCYYKTIKRLSDVEQIEQFIDETPYISDLQKDFYKAYINARYEKIMLPAFEQAAGESLTEYNSSQGFGQSF